MKKSQAMMATELLEIDFINHDPILSVLKHVANKKCKMIGLTALYKYYFPNRKIEI